MKRSSALISFALAVVLLPAFGQWHRSDSDEGICQRETGESVSTGYVSKSYTTAVCNALNRFESWLGTAEALSVRLALTRSCDGSFNTGFPAGDKCGGATVSALSLGIPQAPLSTQVIVPRTSDCSGGTQPYDYFLDRGTDPANLAYLVNSESLFSDSTYIDSTVLASTTYYYRAYCVGAGANQSPYSNVVSVTTPGSNPGDTTAPSVPANCAQVAKGADFIEFDCDASTDDTAVTGYICTLGYGDGAGNPISFIGDQTIGTGATCRFNGIKSNQEHYLRKAAFDAAGNTSNASTRLFITTDAMTPAVIAAAATGSTTIDVSLTTEPEGGLGPYTYSIQRSTTMGSGHSEVGTAFTDDTFGDSSLTESTTYYYIVVSTDAYGVQATSSEVSATTEAAVADTTAPDCSACSISFSSVTSSSAVATFSGATDGVGVTGYRPLVGLGDGNGAAQPNTGLYYADQSSATFNITTYNGSALSAGQQYYVRFHAKDAAGNVSTISDRFFFTASGSAPPSGNTIPAAQIINSEDFEAHAAGPYQPVANKWARGDNPTTCCTIGTTPIDTGMGKNFRPQLSFCGTSCYRSEYWYIGAPYGTPTLSLTQLPYTRTWTGPAAPSPATQPDTHLYTTTARWYGFQWCVDTYNGNTGTIFWQFHEDSATNGNTYYHPTKGLQQPDFNPIMAVQGGPNGGLRVWTDHMNEQVPGDTDSSGALLSEVILAGSSVVGCHKVAIKYRPDSRTQAQGGQGLLAVYIDDATTPKYSLVNRQTYPTVAEGGDFRHPYFNIGGYTSAFRQSSYTEPGFVRDGRYDNFVVAIDSPTPITAEMVFNTISLANYQ